MERKIPSALWISIAALGAMTLIQLIIGVQRGSNALLVTVILNVVVLAGLLLGHKWAYVVVLVLGVGGPIALLSRDARYAMTILLVDGLVTVPMILSTRFFFPGRPGQSAVEKMGAEQP
jgi:hypothetical protein